MSHPAPGKPSPLDWNAWNSELKLYPFIYSIIQRKLTECLQFAKQNAESSRKGAGGIKLKKILNHFFKKSFHLWEEKETRE